MATITLEKHKLLAFYRHIKQKADGYFNERVKPDWDANWKLFLDLYDFGDYKAETENVRLPVADNLVTRLSSIFARALTNLDGEYFTIEKVPDSREFEAAGCEQSIDYIFEDNNFSATFKDSLAHALVTSILCYKIVYEVSEVKFKIKKDGKEDAFSPLRGRIKLKPINPYNIRIDPTDGSTSYMMEIVRVPLHEFRRLAQDNKWIAKEVKGVIDAKLSPPPTENRADGQQKERTEYIQKKEFNPMVELRFVYTKVAYDEEGKQLAENFWFIVADDNYIVHIEENNLPNGLFPYVIGAPLGSIGNKYGRGYLTKLRSLILNYIEIIDLATQAFRFSILGMWAYDPAAVTKKAGHDFTKIIRPSKWYAIPPNAIKNIYDNPIGMQTAIQMQGLYDFLMQILSFQNEFVQGRPTTKGRPTASEIRMKATEAQSFFNDIAIELEDKIIAPLIEMCLIVLMIHWDDPNFAAKESLVPDPKYRSAIDSLTPMERVDLILSGQIRARGMSGRIRRANMFDKLALLFQIGAQYPPIIQRIDPEKINKIFFESLGENASDWLIPEEQLEQNTLGGLDIGNLPPEVLQLIQQQVGGGDNAQSPTGQPEPESNQ